MTDRTYTLGKPYDPDSDKQRYLESPVNDLAASPGLPHVIDLYDPILEPVVIGRDPDGSPLLDSHALTPGEHRGWALHLPWEKNPLPMNQARHGHYAQKAREVAAVRDLAYTLALRTIPHQDRIRVRLDWIVTARRDRDEDNVVRCMKALTDGIRIAGVITKDTRDHCLRDMPVITYQPPTEGRAHMRLWILKHPA